MPLLLGEFVGQAIVLEEEMFRLNPVAPPCVRTHIHVVF